MEQFSFMEISFSIGRAMPVSGESKEFVKKLSGEVRELPAHRKIFTQFGIALIPSQTGDPEKCSRAFIKVRLEQERTEKTENLIL